MNNDYYQVLGVDKNATPEQISKAYRALALKYHPDRQHGKSDAEKAEAEQKFKECSEAYNVLSDKEQRAKYDQFGNSGGFQFDAGAFNPFDMFRKHFGGMPFGGPMFGGMDFGFESPSSREDGTQPQNGSDLQMNMSLSFKESMFGCVKSISLSLDDECPECHGMGTEKGTKPQECPHCHGQGRTVHVERNGFMMSQTISPCIYCNGTGKTSTPCKKCNGSGRISAKKSLSIKIPAGIDSGQRIKLAGKGECGIRGGKNGDMFINVNVKKNDVFIRDGLNLKIKMPIDVVTASLCGKVHVKTPFEELDVQLDKPMKSGDVQTLKGHGVRYNDMTGDLLIEYTIMPYRNLDASQRQLLENIKSSIPSSCVQGIDAFNSKMDKALD